MPTSRTRALLLAAGLVGLAATPAPAFEPELSEAPVAATLDGKKTDLSGVGAFEKGKDAPAAPTPAEAFRIGAKAYLAGDKRSAYRSLRVAADGGHAIAQWKLGRMFAEGDGVERDPLQAFEYFSRIADAHADESPSAPRARFVSNAFVALGSYYLAGIPESAVKPNTRRALEMFTYAASYFGDPDAQFELGRLFLAGKGVENDPRQAARWLGLAARKSHKGAQATLGEMLFRGTGVPRRPAEGLMWLDLAKAQVAGVEGSWILSLHEHAFTEAASSDRERARELAEAYRAKR